MQKYSIDMTALDEAYDTECQDFFSLTSSWRDLTGRQVVSKPLKVKGNCAGWQWCPASALNQVVRAGLFDRRSFAHKAQ